MGTVPIPQGATVQDDAQPQGDTEAIPKGAIVADTAMGADSKLLEMADKSYNDLTPEEKQLHDDVMKANVETLSGKYGDSMRATLGAAGVIGATKAGITAFAPYATKGVKGITAWAAAHPMTAKLVWEGLKAGITGAAAATGTLGAMKIAKKIINAAP